MKVAVGNKMITFCDICGNAIALYKPEQVYHLKKRNVQGEWITAQNFHICQRCAPLLYAFCELSNMKHKKQ